MSLSDNDVSYLVFIPFITAGILFIERRKISLSLSYRRTFGCGLLFLAIFFALTSLFDSSPSLFGLRLSGYVFSLVLFWISGFALIFGTAVCKFARFPLMFLLLMVPLPNFILDHIIYFLQVSSAWITGILFDFLGVPVLRDGLVFHLPSVNIEVARECSGIRSSLAGLVVALLAGHFFFRSFWSKAVFLVGGFFIMILKNGIRITSLTLLGIYVDPSFLYGRLHHQGGMVFFILGLLLLAPLLKALQYMERSARNDYAPLAQPVSRRPP